MPISETLLKHWIDNFYGYGSWEAPIWFVAFEEGGGDVPKDVQDRITYFSTYHTDKKPTLCDIRDLYRNIEYHIDGPKSELYSNRFDCRFGTNAVQHGLWKNLIAFVKTYRKKKIKDLFQYQLTEFAAPGSDENLIQLYPLPSPHNHAWYYSWVDVPGLPFLSNRDLYQQHLYSSRIGTIISQIQEHDPEVVLMYGMQNINSLKASFLEAFPSAKFTMVKAEPQVTPQYHYTELGNTKLIITTQIPALRHNRIETGFDWTEFGKRIRG